MSRGRGRPGPDAPAAVVAPPPVHGPIRPAGATGGFFGHWVRLVAVLVGVLYLATLAIGWISTASAGHEGIMRTHEEARTEDGIIVGDVAPGSPADGAGLRPGDVLLAIDGIPATDGDAIHDLYHRQRAGDSTTLVVRRASGPAPDPPQSVDPATALIYGVPRPSALVGSLTETLSFVLLSRLAIPSIVIDMLIRSVAGLLIAAMAVGVALARPRELAARLLLIFGTTFATMPISDIWHWGLPAARMANTFDDASLSIIMVGGAALLHLFLAFPAPSPLLDRLRRTGWGVPLLYGVPLGVAVAAALLHAWALPFPLLLAMLVGALVALVRSYLHAPTPLAHAQLKWIVWALGTGIAAVAFAQLFPAATGGRDRWVVPTVSLAAWALFPIAIGLAILRYRLFDIDVIINRTLVYGVLTACVVGIYVLVVGSLGLLFQSSGSVIDSLLATGLVAVLFQPLRERLQRAVNRLVYGERDDPYAVLSRLGRRLEGTLAPEAVLPTVVQTVREALKLPYAAIALEQDGAFALAAASGEPVGAPLQVPLVYQHETVGRLILAPRTTGGAFGLTDRRLLDDLARQAGAAAHAVRLTADLQRARERLVTAREEERRRLRRDLHDGLGPALAAQTLKVGVARSLLAHDPPAADARLAELETDLDTALADIRRLVYNLRPPALDELGLVAAIRESAARYSAPAAGGASDGADRLRITVVAPEWLPPLPAAVEVAAYRIVQEALTNVVRHAGARNCIVRLAFDEVLHVEIADDGVGLALAGRAGVGLASMRERAAELSGTCVVEMPPTGGARVLARLPLPSGPTGPTSGGRSLPEEGGQAPDGVGARA